MTNNHRAKLQFSVGYPCHLSFSFYDAIAPYLDRIGEVYFAWGNFATGRATFYDDPRENREKLKCDLLKFKQRGIKLNLLLNGNCYGEKSLSPSLADEAVGIVEEVAATVGLDAVTVVSPFLVHSIKKHFPNIDVRASVNTWIDGISGMSQCEDLFDSFYVKRDYNYCIDEIRAEKEWCEKRNKKLYLLANSGCIPYCVYHTFHDNMVAHSKEMEREEKAHDFEPYVCGKLFAKPENRYLLLSGNMVRPEDVHFYEGIVDGVKLATRVHSYPAIIIGAYAKERWLGSVCDLSEPGFGTLLQPYKLDNVAVPQEYWATKTTCMRARNKGSIAFCQTCGYCKGVYDNILCRE